MTNRKGLPPTIKAAKLKRRGELVQTQKGNMIATAFRDKRQITFLSTCEQPGVSADGKPFVNISYNENMGGVDKSDQYRAYLPVGRPGKKWWRYILWILVNSTTVNSYIVFTKLQNPPPPKDYDHMRFRVDVASQLCAGYSSRKHKAGRPSKNPDIEVNGNNIDLHKMEKINGRKSLQTLF